MPRQPSVPAKLVGAPFVGSAAVAAGLLTRDQLRSSAWRLVHRDVYVHKSCALDLAVRAQAAGLIVPAGGAVSGMSAAALYLPHWRPEQHRVEVTVPPGRGMRSRSGLIVRHSPLEPSDVWRVRDTAVTSPVRTSFDVARSRDLESAVSVLDALWADRRTSASSVANYANARTGWRGVNEVFRVCDLADPGAESPMETRLRLIIVRAGLPKPKTQFSVRNRAGRFLARLDLAYPELRIGIEYDGTHHFEGASAASDRARQNALINAGWILLRYVAADVFRGAQMIVNQVAATIEMRSNGAKGAR